MAARAQAALGGPAPLDDEVRARRLEKLRFWRRACAELSRAMTPYNVGEGANPLFFFHGDFDTGGHYLRRVAGEAGLPVVGIAPHGLHGEAVPPDIEAMAEDRVREILAYRPAGPFRLGGYCNGALVAYEAGRRLAAAGHAVDVVILVEPASLNMRPGYRSIHRLLSRVARGRPQALGAAMLGVWAIMRLMQLGPAQAAALLRVRWIRAAQRRRRLREERSGEGRLQDTLARLTTTYYRASAAYRPLPADLPVVALSTGRDGGGRPWDLYDGAAWSRVAPRFRAIRLPGHHATCLSEHAGVLAGHLAALLADRGDGTQAGVPPGERPDASRPSDR